MCIILMPFCYTSNNTTSMYNVESKPQIEHYTILSTKWVRFCYLQLSVNSLFFFNFYLFILWLCWDFVSVRGLSLVAASGGHSSSRCAGLPLSWPLLVRSTGSGRAGSVVVAHGPSCSAACGIFPDQGPNPCPLHWQADSQPLRHQRSPVNSPLFIQSYFFFQSWI